jgi:16S rRNA (cytosine1402-N4)-methyltransferase
MDLPATGHDPVLLEEIVQYLQPSSGQTYVDCTLGRAGHACAMAPLLGPAGLLIGLDVDPRNLEFARQSLANAPCQTRLFHANFAELPEVLAQIQEPKVDLILADLGLSTNQLFDEHYGLSFASAMPLDMRIDPRVERSAADLVNTLPETELANLLFNLAQERHSRRIARKIIETRKVSPIKSTDELAELVRRAIPARGRSGEKIDPATRTFLALRLAVNQELENLEALLRHAPRHLKPGGRLGIISFQSMEDRLVKQAFRAGQTSGELEILTRKPITPSDEEIARNPRSRSAKLRVAVRR